MNQMIKSAGTATVAELARHWDVDRATALHILECHHVPFIETEGPFRLAWTDIWAAEGAGYVSPGLYTAFKAPLLRVERLGVPPANCSRPDAYMRLANLKPSALRARIAKIGKPIIRLAPRTRRVRVCDLDAVLERLAN